MAVMIAGCKSNPATNTKLDNKTESMLKGDWTLTSVSYPGSEYIKVTSFQIADSKCFEGSKWKFVSVSNKGQLDIPGSSGCAAFSSPITWFINKDGQFVLKVLYAGEKARKVRDGYVLSMGTVSSSNFQLVDKIDVGGQMTDVVYNFSKN
jgi:hypothetical protein